MVIRIITYHALPGKDVERWMQTSASELRGVKGMRRVEFIRSQSDYKEAQKGTYQTLVRSLRESWLDESKPVTEQIFEVLDI